MRSSAPPPPGVSPSPTTLQDRYSSPPKGPFCRRLFVDPLDGEPGVTANTNSTSTVPAAKTGQASLVTAIPAGPTMLTVTANNGQTVSIPVHGENLNTVDGDT